ncbi:MAG: hypothetical protein HZA21_02125 [Nitrospirae bacterium]|nr:hypothetical protein [Nitrospirota bacterium]
MSGCTRLFHSTSALAASVMAFLFGLSLLPIAPAPASSEKTSDHLKRAKVFLAAGDYRRALESCQREVDEAPSAESYVYLTYVYHAIDGYLESLAKADRWVGVEHLYLNLAIRDAQDLVDPPDVLARIAKEIIQGSVQRQADVSAAMAARLDSAAVERLWKQQTAWRKAKPDGWWAGVPEEWGW